jgi:glycosyltransferase involved in cell wall biosynthesis
VPAGCEESLAKAMLEILKDKEKAEHMGSAAREFALQHLDISQCASKFISLYEKIAATN